MLDWLERKIGWIAFPSIIRYLAMFQLGILALSFVNPTASQLLSFDWQQITEGQVWRLLTFVFVPIGSLAGVEGTMTVIFSLFAALLLMSFSDGLESQWGVFRTTLFFIGGWIVCLITSVVFSTVFGYYDPETGKLVFAIPNAIQPSLLFDYAILFAFATYYPKYELRLFFVLPVPIVIIAIVGGISILLSGMLGVPFLIYSLLCLSHYLVVAIPLLMKRGKRQTHKIKAKAKYDKQPSYFHKCSVCGTTDEDDDSLVFRVRQDGEEICEKCSNSD